MVVCLCLSGCVPVLCLHGPVSKPEKYDAHLKLPQAERDIEYRKMSIEEQYDYMLFTQLCVHPRLLGYTVLFAENGEAGIDFLKERLDEDPSDDIVLHILLTLREIVCSNECCESRRQEVAEIIETQIEAMRWKKTRRFTMEMLSYSNCLDEFIDFSEVRTND